MNSETLKRKYLWEDPDFPAIEKSLNFPNHELSNFSEWLRPQEIIRKRIIKEKELLKQLNCEEKKTLLKKLRKETNWFVSVTNAMEEVLENDLNERELRVVRELCDEENKIVNEVNDEDRSLVIQLTNEEKGSIVTKLAHEENGILNEHIDEEIFYKPRFICKTGSRCDIKQGSLDDCWFLTAVTCLANEENIDCNESGNRWFEKVVPQDQEFDDEYMGFFYFRFWRYGQWIRVTVDDLLPVDKYGKLIFARSSRCNEFWAALLEKAYAKLHGSYYALSFGTPGEAFTDLTGGICRCANIQRTDRDKIKEALEASFCNLPKCTPRLVAAAIWKCPPAPLDETGLAANQDYSIIDFKTVKKTNGYTVDLIKMWNPLGKKWKGEWSDGSEEWKSVKPTIKRTLLSKRDDEFWIPLDRFKTNFSMFEICLVPERFTKNEIILKFKCSTERDVPHFRLLGKDYLKDCYMEIMQQGRRENSTSAEDRFFNIGFKIYKKRKETWGPFSQGVFIDNGHTCDALSQRNVVKCLNDIEPGNYIIVPSLDSLMKNGKFLIRLFQKETNWQLNRIKENTSDVGKKT